VPIPVFALAIAGWLGVVAYVLALGRVAALADRVGRGRAGARKPPLYKRGGGRIKASRL
jgi:hypothetical protein